VGVEGDAVDDRGDETRVGEHRSPFAERQICPDGDGGSFLPFGDDLEQQLGAAGIELVAPTSLSARPASFRPEIELLGDTTRVLVEQVGAIDAGRLGDLVGRVTPDQQWGIDEALTTVLGLR
jgi:mRNA-degrading endonuclease toxin of MazEF toxin-antitoxin module